MDTIRRKNASVALEVKCTNGEKGKLKAQNKLKEKYQNVLVDIGLR